MSRDLRSRLHSDQIIMEAIQLALQEERQSTLSHLFEDFALRSQSQSDTFFHPHGKKGSNLQFLHQSFIIPFCEGKKTIF